MLATFASAALQGIDAELVHVEVNAGEVGEPKLILVGLPDAAVKESDDRVFSALSNSGFRPPRSRTTINLAPGNLRKEGPFYDLPIALGILAATDQLHAEDFDRWMIAGELSLSGATRPVRGALAMARLARRLHKRGLLLPGVSAEEAAHVEGIDVYRIHSLDQAARFLSGEIHLTPLPLQVAPPRPAGSDCVDFTEVKGQHALRRAVEIAVAGGHNLLMLFRQDPTFRCFGRARRQVAAPTAERIGRGLPPALRSMTSPPQARGEHGRPPGHGGETHATPVAYGHTDFVPNSARLSLLGAALRFSAVFLDTRRRDQQRGSTRPANQIPA